MQCFLFLNRTFAIPHDYSMLLCFVYELSIHPSIHTCTHMKQHCEVYLSIKW